MSDMSMGQIHIDPHTGRFVMETPDGDRPVSLRATIDGHVMVEEIVGGGVTVEPLKITTLPANDYPTSVTAAELQRLAERQTPRH